MKKKCRNDHKAEDFSFEKNNYCNLTFRQLKLLTTHTFVNFFAISNPSPFKYTFTPKIPKLQQTASLINIILQTSCKAASFDLFCDWYRNETECLKSAMEQMCLFHDIIHQLLTYWHT